MKRSWFTTGLGAAAALVMATSLTFTPVHARPEDKDEKTKAQTNPAWGDPTISGHVINTFWIESKTPGQKTAVIVVWHDDGDLAVTVYADDPIVRDAIINRTACVGRYVIVTGDRIDEDELVGRGIQVPDIGTECTATL
jgi:hypothetical protein